jgi:Protein of unknown function (DUF3224)
MDTTSTFIVTEFNPSDQELDVETALPTGLATITKRFSGAIEGHSQALFCSAFDPTHGGTYVALESFGGQVDGHHGTFSFAHAATTGADGERTDGWFTIVSGSGTGELAGIHGKGDIVIDSNGNHHLNLAYELG